MMSTRPLDTRHKAKATLSNTTAFNANNSDLKLNAKA